MKAKKSLGQNFLNDSNILDKISNSTCATKGDLIIEIGPGTGNLTRKLLNTGADVIAFELDERMHECLDDLVCDNFELIFEDFLKVDINKFVNKSKYNKTFVIANIPYYISTPIIKKIINYRDCFDEVVLLVQKEYAQRICAKCGSHDYDSLTVFVNYFCETSILLDVGRKCFSPAPNVDSAVIKLKPIIRNFFDVNGLMDFIDDCFKQKRKTLKNNIGMYGWDKIETFLNNIGFSSNVRAEQLSIDQFIELYNVIKNK